MNNNSNLIPPNECSALGITACRPILPSRAETELQQAGEIVKSFLLHLIVSLAFLFTLEIFDRALTYTSIANEFKDYIKIVHEWLALTTYIVFSGAVTYKFITRMWRWITK